ncbi:MAG: D-glycero-beta-D-manno-heptose-7-phosphate kinase [Candidatus Omnitrophica bacterium]|nr:D-glycero-beta-D-manno-heptose-7-phosphate kinase [Candidatus Omnitrophota bacterium]
MRNLKETIQKFPQAKILVIGDLILDEYIWGEVERISPEAPVPVVWAKRRSYVPGGAANVASNISSLGAEVLLLGVVGKDENAQRLHSELKKRGIPTCGIIVDSGRHTTVKTRILAGHQQIVRLDWEHTESLDKKINQKLIRIVNDNINDTDAVIIEDYGKGVINADLIAELISFIRKKKKLVTVDPKEEHFQFYRGVTSITPNRKELENAIRVLKMKDTAHRLKLTSDKLSTDKDIDKAGLEILRYLKVDSLLVTLGDRGMRLFQQGGRIDHIPTAALEVFDVSGAGDTVVATFTLAISCGATNLEAAHLANYAAGIVVSKLGTAVTTPKELLERIPK